MAEILIGTSGFYYDDWRGPFYPIELKKGDFLSYYSEHFKTLELNFSFYRIPSPAQSTQMLSKAGGRLSFVIKAYRELTHEISDDSLGGILPRYLEGIRPFMEADRLGGILLQFPQRFHYAPHNRVYLKTLIEGLGSCPLFIEFRQKAWLRDSVYKTLEELGAGFVCVDEPALPSLIPPLTVRTSDSAYVRFHGRNRKDWYGTDSTRRYDYLYSLGELKGWVSRIETLARDVERLYAFFNNHAKAQAVTNARMLMNLLE